MKHAKLSIDKNTAVSKVSHNIYGHFTEHLGRCIYDGIFVGKDSAIPNTDGIRNDVIEALKDIKTPVLRWPGGCFADEYHWRDGIGEIRRRIVNSNWGGVVEDNSFGTHEFMRLCELVGCEPYIAGNVGSGTVRELADWIEYMTFDGDSALADERRKNGRDKPWKLKYLGIGNESWGCGGSMTPEYYSNVYKRYQSFCRNLSGNKLFKVACGPNGDDYDWTEKLMSRLDPNWHLDALSLHYYTIPTGDWEHKGSATDFSDEEYYSTIKKTLYMEELITKHSEIMKRYDKSGRVKLFVDEWGVWLDPEEGTNPAFLYQQNSMRDAMVAAINLNIFNNHSDIVGMANIAQAVNVLQSVVLTDSDKIIKTPTYYVFKMFAEHQDATLLCSELSGFEVGGNVGLPSVSASVTRSDKGMLVTLTNCSLVEEAELEINAGDALEAKIITSKSPCDFNDFDSKERVTLKPYNGFFESSGITTVKLPRLSVVSVMFK